MSTWITIRDKDDVDYDPNDNTIDVLIGFDDNYGNHYVSIPVEFIKELLNVETHKKLP